MASWPGESWWCRSNDGISKRHTELLKDGRKIGRLREKTTQRMLVEFKAEN